MLITGSASGIGAAVAELAFARGLRVVGFDIKQPSVTAFHSRFIQCDISDLSSIDQALQRLDEPVDYLVNSAGVTGSHSAELVYRVNVLGLQHLTEQLLPRIRDNGSVINVASGAGVDWPKNLPAILPIIQAKEQPVRLRQCLQHASEGGRAYNFSKEIIIVLTKRLAKKEWARGVSVNSVSPGGVLTGMIPEFRSSMGEIVDWSIDKVGRHAEPVEIARPILWLTSEDAGWVNGADLVVDGGLLAGIQVGSFALGE